MYAARCRHLSPLLTGFQFTSTGGTSAVVDHGSNDFPSITCGAAGKVVAAQQETACFNRGPVVVGSPGADVADGGFAMFDTLPADGAITMELAGAAGSGDDGTGYVIAMGFGDADTDRFDDAQIVRTTINDGKLLGWRITNNGTVAVASGGLQASVARVSTGIVTLTFSPGHPKIRSAKATPINASCRAERITSFDGDSITVKITDEGGTVQDSDFTLLVLVSGNMDSSGGYRDPLRVPQLYPEIVCGRVLDTAGTPSITLGGATNGVDFALTDNGVGDITVTLTAPGLRTIVPVVTAKDNRAQLLLTPTLDVFRVGIFNAAAAATDDSFDFICLVYNADTAQEF